MMAVFADTVANLSGHNELKARIRRKSCPPNTIQTAMSVQHRILVVGFLALVAGGCGSSENSSAPSVMVEAQHTHYHVHAPDASHEHSHVGDALGGHTHSHQHSDHTH
jgi:hypothetical protein